MSFYVRSSKVHIVFSLSKQGKVFRHSKLSSEKEGQGYKQCATKCQFNDLHIAHLALALPLRKSPLVVRFFSTSQHNSVFQLSTCCTADCSHLESPALPINTRINNLLLTIDVFNQLAIHQIINWIFNKTQMFFPFLFLHWFIRFHAPLSLLSCRPR